MEENSKLKRAIEGIGLKLKEAITVGIAKDKKIEELKEELENRSKESFRLSSSDNQDIEQKYQTQITGKFKNYYFK